MSRPVNPRQRWEETHGVHLTDHATSRWDERSPPSAVSLETAYERSTPMPEDCLQVKFECAFPPRLYVCLPDSDDPGPVCVFPVRREKRDAPRYAPRVIPTVLVDYLERDPEWVAWLAVKGRQFLDSWGADR